MVQEKQTLTTQYETLRKRAPKIVTKFVPTNAAEQRRAVFRNEVQNPDHRYEKLDKTDFEADAEGITQVGEQILKNPELNPKFEKVYESSIERYQQVTRLMQLAHDFKQAQDPEQKDQLRQEYMKLNVELYGAPDEQTYRSLLQEKLQKINNKELSSRGEEIRAELFALTNFEESSEVPERFKPEDETVEWMKEVAQTLYGGMLAHVPDQELFTRTELHRIFTEIIRDELGEAAADWEVVIQAAKSINVVAADKQVIIPDDRADLTLEEVRQLVVHELGVHMLRSVIGGESDLHPLAGGLEGYYDAEEGLGMVMQQAIDGEFVEAGVDHYITAGAAYFDGMDFRQAYEVKWRMEVLDSLEDGRVVTPLAVAKAKEKAYNGTLRSFRGTDELPLFKDLSYYNGSVDMWRHLELIRGDDVKFMFVLLGKGNPANIAHERIQYETSTI